MYGDKREKDTPVVAVAAHHSTAKREGPPGLAVVAQPHLRRVRARQGWVVVDVERLEGEVISLCGAGRVCVAMKTGLLLAGLRINFNQRAPLAGFVTPCVTVWDRSGSTPRQPSLTWWGSSAQILAPQNWWKADVIRRRSCWVAVPGNTL